MKAHKTLFCIVILTMFLFSGQNAFSTMPYFNDFSSYINTPGAEWSSTGGDLKLSETPSGENFLGRIYLDEYATDYGFQNETVSLTLTNLPMNAILDISFDLFILNSWDGNEGEYAPDFWSFGVAGESPLLRTTFAYHPDAIQSYPNNYPAENPAETGAAASNTLGYLNHREWCCNWDTIYDLNFYVPYSGTSVTLEFTGYGLQEYSAADESWGLDNVGVEVIPEPSTVLLFGAGLLSLCCFGKLRKKKGHESS